MNQRPIIISVTSGKGGVGKTTTTGILSQQMADLGKRVLVLDGDLGMANLDLFYGVRTHYHLQDVISGDKKLKEILIPVRDNITLIPSGSGVLQLNQLNHFQRRSILDQISSLQNEFDVLLIDTAPGLNDNVLFLNCAADLVVTVITQDPASFTDAYALIKVLNQEFGQQKFFVMPNQVESEKLGHEIFQRFEKVVDHFLDVSLIYAGALPFEGRGALCTLQNAQNTNSAEFKRAVLELSTNLISVEQPVFKNYGIDFFFEQAIGWAS